MLAVKSRNFNERENNLLNQHACLTFVEEVRENLIRLIENITLYSFDHSTFDLFLLVG